MDEQAQRPFGDGKKSRRGLVASHHRSERAFEFAQFFHLKICALIHR
jgi:hypothetical protein